MGSTRRKKEKQKDFVKSKLKVGKTAAKPSNYTDTSFTAKTISLPSQSILKSHTTDSNLSHYISLTKHHAPITRKESLHFITSHLPPASNTVIYKEIMTAIIPLMIDTSKSVRNALIECLIKILNRDDPAIISLFQVHLKIYLLYLKSSMSHLNTKIRSDSSTFFKILFDSCSNELIENDKNWDKLLSDFMMILGWNKDGNISDNLLLFDSNNADTSTQLKHLQVFSTYLQYGLDWKRLEFVDEVNEIEFRDHPYANTHAFTPKYLLFLNQKPQPFDFLGLFKPMIAPSENESSIKNNEDDYSLFGDTLESRNTIFKNKYYTPLVRNFNILVKDGGMLGREAAKILKFLKEWEEHQREIDL